MAYREDLDMGKITLISVVSVLVTVALLLFLQVLYYGFRSRQLASAKYTQPDAELSNYVANQQGHLIVSRPVEGKPQVASIPIDTAMQLVVRELNTDPTANVTGVPDPESVADEAESNESGGDDEEAAGTADSSSEEEAAGTGGDEPDADKNGTSADTSDRSDTSESSDSSDASDASDSSEVEGGEPNPGGSDPAAGEEDESDVDS